MSLILNYASTDLSWFPEELQSAYNSEKINKPSASKHSQFSFGAALSKIDDLAKEEGKQPLPEKEKENEDDDDDGGAASFEDEEIEDDTDYNNSYFDNGEDYGDYGDGDGGGGDRDEAVY